MAPVKYTGRMTLTGNPWDSIMTNPVPQFLNNKDPRLILFGGKGGVGKTTMAAATALHLARSCGHDKNILVISTDPAHSLSDSFGIEIGDRVTAINYDPKTKSQDPISNDHRPISNLFACELDASRLLDEFKGKNHDVMMKLAERGTYFDQEDITGFIELSLPGADEVMSIVEMADLLKEGNYHILIIDMAPTGHLVRMLNLPGQMQKWVEILDLMQQKHRYMFRHFTGKRYVKDASDLFLEELSSDIHRVEDLLSDREKTQLVPVMVPELMSIYETDRLIRELEKIGVPVREIIVNQVAESGGCSFCRSKRDDQKRPMIEIENLFSKYDLIRIPQSSCEIRGINGLKKTADYILGVQVPPTPLKQAQRVEASRSWVSLDTGLEFLLFGGKGGVGKTTLASAAALNLVRRNPGKKVLLFSLDPAHSLSDILDQLIGDEITPILFGPESNMQHPMTNDQSPKSTLYALEIDPDALWRDFKGEFKSDIEVLFDRFLSRGANIRFDRDVMMEMLEFAPPGVDEIMSLDRIMDLRNKGAFDIFVLDTSPTGHLLRFLELPDLAREWLKAFFKLLLKYKGSVRLTRAAERALFLFKNVKRIQETLTDPARTDFVATTTPEAMAFLELERLMDALEAGKIPCSHIIINKVVPWTDCGFCSTKRSEQEGYVRRISSRFPERTIVQAPLFPRQIRGFGDLEEIGLRLFSNGRKG